MSWVSWLVGKSKDTVIGQGIEAIRKGADELYHSGEEKAEEKAEFEREITKRWIADSQAPITRLVRPVSYLFVTIALFIFGALDNSLEGFEMSQEWIDLYKEVYIVMTIALFGGRSWEKVKDKK